MSITQGRTPVIAAPERERARGEFLRDGLHIFVLCSLALAQPLFDLLSRYGEFFVVRRSPPADLILLVIIVSILVPLAVVVAEAAAAFFVGRLGRKAIHVAAVASLISVLAMQLLKRGPELPGIVMALAAATGGIAMAAGLMRWPPAGTFLTLLSPAVVLFPVLFLLHPSVAKIIFSSDPQDEASLANRVENPVPVVLVVFDELPLTSLMDEHRHIDNVRFPSFASLAHDAMWFRNGTTVSSNTIYAVPAILTGKYPDHALHPTAADHPHSLFSLLHGTYRLNASEPVTQLSRIRGTGTSREGATQRLKMLLSDVGVLYLHLLIPRDWSVLLPPVGNTWADFARSGIRAATATSFTEFAEMIVAAEPLTFHFVHLPWPHGPYVFLPSGKTYIHDPAEALSAVDGRWPQDEWTVRQAYQQHLLQVGYADRLLGELLERLNAAGLYDRALIVVTADHGVSFRSGDEARQPTETNLPDIMAVPLFVKLPYQRDAQISDRNVETIDILPTVAQILGIQVPWPLDGHSAVGTAGPERAEKRIEYGQGRLTVRDSLDIGSALDRRIRLFGSGKTPERLFAIGPHSELVGRPVESLEVAAPEDVSVYLDNPHLFRAIDLGSNFVPALISGRVRSRQDTTAHIDLAISVNGVIRATTRTYTLPTLMGERGTRSWRTVVNESSFRNGRNDVEVFTILTVQGRRVLGRTLTADEPMDYRNVVLGAARVRGIRESGFAGPESWWKGKAVRWTAGAAQLIVPVDTRRPPNALRIDLADTGPDGTILRVLVNGDELLNEPVPPGRWSRILGLGDRVIEHELRIDLISGTFVPKERNKDSVDLRRLGVAIEAIVLLDQ